MKCGLTFIILNYDSQWNGWLTLSNKIDTLDSELVHPSLLQAFNSESHVGADLCVAGLKGLLVLPLLLYEVPNNWAATITARWFPGQSDGVFGPLCVVELFRV